MSNVFSLRSSCEFVVPIDDKTVEVFRYEDDIKRIGLKYYDRNTGESEPPVYVGRGKEYGAIEVFGTVIAGGELEQLAKDLKAVEEDPNLYTFVNCLGLCVITEKDYSFDVILINYHFFGWPNYAVKLPPGMDKLTVWHMAYTEDTEDDESSLYDSEGTMGDMAEADEELRRSLQETNVKLVACRKVMEEKNVELAACKKELEKKNVELVACKVEMEEKGMELMACKKELVEKGIELTAYKKELEWSKKDIELTAYKKELEWSKKMESLFNKLVEAKEKEVEMVNSQLLAFKAHPEDVE